jgi:uncharacterized protein YjbJ (UPF0337 family)
MVPSTKNEIDGKLHEVKGAVKQTLGKITDNPKLEAEGTTEKVTGQLQHKLGQVQKVVEKP